MREFIDGLSPATITVIAVVAAIFAFGLIVTVVHGSITAAKTVFSFTRNQVRRKFWRDSGKLATLISLALLVIAYGLYERDQPRPLSDALLRLGRDRLLEVLPIAILTQVVLLAAFWLIYGRIFRVPRKTLWDPFKILWGVVLWVAFISAGSIAVMLATRRDPGRAMIVLIAAGIAAFLFIVLAPATRRPGLRPRRGMAPSQVVWLVFAIAVMLGLSGAPFALVYTLISHEPTVLGLIGFNAIVIAFMTLIASYRFRAYIGRAKVPPATGYFIDFSLAISALAVALVSQPSAAVTLGRVPPWLIAVIPALLVAAAVFAFNLVRLRPTTPRWALCLVVAIVAGLLAGPAKAVLAPVLTPIAHLLPLPGIADEI